MNRDKCALEVELTHGSKRMESLIKKLANTKVKYRRCSYKGRGRPRGEDVVYIPLSELADYRRADVLLSIATSYYSPTSSETRKHR